MPFQFCIFTELQAGNFWHMVCNLIKCVVNPGHNASGVLTRTMTTPAVPPSPRLLSRPPEGGVL